MNNADTIALIHENRALRTALDGLFFAVSPLKPTGVKSEDRALYAAFCTAGRVLAAYPARTALS